MPGINLLLVLLSFMPTASAPAPTSTFRVDGGVACGVVAQALVCEGTRSGSMSIRATGTPVSSTRRVRTTSATPALQTGATWRRQGVSCTALRREISCTNRSGAVLRLSADRVVVLADTGAATSP